MGKIEIRFPDRDLVALPAFRDRLGSKERYRLFWGGRGSGKSTFVARDKIIKCLTAKYFRCIITRKIYADIKDSIYDTIKQEIIDGGFEHLFEFNVSPLEIKCINGNKFIARGFDRPDKTKSIKDPTDVIYEEANEITKEDFMVTTTSVRTTKADYLQEDLIFNPEFDTEAADNWMVQKFLMDGDTVREYSFNDVIKVEVKGQKYQFDYCSTHSTYHDNIDNLSMEFIAYLESLRDFDPYYYEVYTLGLMGYRKIENAFATHYDPVKHESTEAKRIDGYKIYKIIDFNIDPFSAIYAHIWQDEKGYHVHVFDEETIPGGTIQKMVDETKTRIGSLHNFEMTGDFQGNKKQIGLNDNASMFAQLKKGLKLRDRQVKLVTNPLHKVSRDDLNYVLYNHPDFKINPKTCPNTCRQMKITQCDATGSIIKTNRKKEAQLADHFDCIRYLVNSYVKDWIKKDKKRFMK